ncbi:Os04g0161100 [Oryza sativa Japonica Group]|uniref:Os04g0161100 protein n=1 Tax=Oryza sativa subsp. japonica TaxID=39947 RepID=Q0JF50_ORYSJ|nr:Os04g0161100 [Oryza sativa Japonica Group]|eukprot:NP_001052123.2 Os04g0161100 [Oryza sativa Japonica Group]
MQSRCIYDRVRTLSHQVMTLEDRVWELEHKNTQLLHEKGKLEKQLETKAAAQAISSQKEEVERSLKGENDKLQLEDLTMEENYSQSEAEVEQFQKELGALVEEKEVAAKTFDDDKEKMKMESEYLKRRLEEIHDNKDFMKTENNKLQSEALIVEKKQIMFEAEIKRLKMELGAVTEAKEVAAKAFNAQNEEITKKLEDLKRKLEEIQTNKDLVEGETNELQPEVFATEEKNSLSEAEIKCLKQILEVAMEVKEAAAESFDAEKEEIMKQSNNLKRKIEENQASKDLVESENDKLRSKMVTVKQKHNQFEADNKSLKIELGALKEAKEATAKAFDVEKAGILKELEDPKRKVEEIQAKKDLVERENDKFQLEVLTGEQKQSKSKAKAKSLKVELSALVEAKEATAKAFDVEKAKIMKELEDLKKKVEEIQGKKDLVEGEKDKLWLEILIVEQKHSMYELEVKRLKLELGALAEAKETAMNSFDTEKIKFIMDVEDLKRKIEEIQVGKEATEEVGRDKDAEADRLRAELMKIGVSLSQMQASYNELDAMA